MQAHSEITENIDCESHSKRETRPTGTCSGKTWQSSLRRPDSVPNTCRMAAVGQQHVRPEAFEYLPGQLEEDVRLPPIGRPLGAAGSRRHDRHPHAVHAQVDRGEENVHGTPGREGSHGKS